MERNAQQSRVLDQSDTEKQFAQVWRLRVIISSKPGMYLEAEKDNFEALPLKSLSLASLRTPISD